MVIIKMIRPRKLLAGLASFLLASTLSAQTYQGRELVKATLLADTSAVVAGKPFTAGLLLRMAPGWHTYWKFSGDAGLPTEIKWTLPPGWKVGEIQWPIPLKTNDPGDIQTYGYQDEIMLMQEITPPNEVGSSAVKLSADATWLVCEKICIPGSGSLALELPTSTTSSPKNTDLFARYRRLLPESFPDRKVAAESWRRSGTNLLLKVTGEKLTNYPTVDFYPLPEGDTVVGHPAVDSRKSNELTFRIPIESPDKNLSSIAGLVVFSQQPNGNDRAAWQLGSSAGISESAPPAAPSRGVVTFLLFGFIGGFILNLMPCVLPVISLKIFGFVKQAGSDRRQIFRSGLAFVAGIFTWFVGLALLLIILKGAGHQITWALQFTNAYFVLFLSAIVTVFALNLFGVFEISAPETAMRLVGSVAQEGNAGSFFHGVFATVLATPCTAPFLGTALGFAFTQSSFIILLMFLAIAAGMSAPYFLLSAQPAWLRFLPKPGPWMEQVKQFMGFLLLATLLFLLYVLGAQRGLDGAIWASCFLLIVAIACWMKGVFVVPAASFAKKSVTIVLMFVLLIFGGIYFIGGKFRQAQADIGQARLPGDWQPFSPDRLQSEISRGHSVFVDFTAAWCLTCKFNEKTVLEAASVRDAFQRHGIVKLKADWTNGDPAITKLLQQFGRPGVPLYVLYPGKSEEPIVFPELLTQRILLDKLETITPAVASQ